MIAPRLSRKNWAGARKQGVVALTLYIARSSSALIDVIRADVAVASMRASASYSLKAADTCTKVHQTGQHHAAQRPSHSAMSSMRFIFALLALSAVPSAFAQQCVTFTSGCTSCTSNGCIWCSSNQFQDLTTGYCQSGLVGSCSTGSQASGSGACDLVGSLNNLANTIRIIIIVVVVLHVVNLAAITFAAHKTVRSPHCPPHPLSSP